MQLDTQGGAFNTTAPWATYDLGRLGITDAAVNAFAGAAFDGRFVYYVPNGAGFATVTRYDTWSTFSADCAWSTVDITQIDAGDAGLLQNFIGAVFDGQYLYLIPDANSTMVRFKATSVPTTVQLPAYHGSFL